MKKKFLALCLSAAMALSLAACGSSGSSSGSSTAGSTSSASDSASTQSAAVNESGLADGTYSAKFTTDNSMFHVNEAYDDRGTLTVKNGEMTIHVTLASENIVNLFEGTAEDAQKDGAKLIEPTTDTVTYDDGTTEECYGFDIPVPAIDEEFDVALVGTKGTWYDHKVKVSDPEPLETDTSNATEEDKEAADKVAALIDAIYVQERNDKTDEQCKEAKEAWDKLTDTQKALVSGTNADPDYFGRDTGDASKDDPLNSDDIGDKELLVVSFGTSYNDSRAEDIGGIEKALQKAYPDWSVRRAFTSQIIINHVEARDGEYIDNMDQALDRAVDNGVKELVVQPTHLMHGAEYDEMSETVNSYKDKFDSVKIAEPLLGEVGSDTTTVNDDKKAVAQDVTAQAVQDAGYDSLQAAADDKTAFVFMGHGTSHEANITYDQMQSEMEDLGYDNVFIGTVEGKPADTACEAVIDKVHNAGYTKVILRPLMVVAGDHANNDMAGDDDDSWKSQFTASGYFDSIDCQIKGMGRIPSIEEIYVSHSSDAIGEDPSSTEAASTAKTASSVSSLNLEDGRYELDVEMEGGSGRASVQSPCSVTVKDGKAEAVVVWSSDKYDYMIVDGQKYENESKKGHSTFTIPVSDFNKAISVKADTTAMSRPHEIDYTLTFQYE